MNNVSTNSLYLFFSQRIFSKTTVFFYLLILCLSPTVIANTFALESFGYKSLTINNSHALGTRPLIMILINSNESDAPRFTTESVNFYRNKFFSNNNTSVLSYFSSESNSKFNWRLDGIRGPYNATHGKCFSQNLADGRKKLREEAVTQLFQDSRFQVANYDTNNDKIITPNELGVLILYSCTTSQGTATSGEVRSINITSNGYTFNGIVASGKQAIEMPTLLHELSHLLGTFDLYNDNDDCACNGITLMHTSHSQTASLDAPHKLALGWIQPHTFNIASIGQMFPHLTNQSENKAYLLYDNTRGNREYFLVERRKKDDIDQQIPEAGFAVWRVQLKNNNSIEKIQLIRPDYHRLNLLKPVTTIKPLFDYTDGAFSPTWQDRTRATVKLRIGDASNNSILIQGGKQYDAAVTLPDTQKGYFFQNWLYKRFDYPTDKHDRTREMGLNNKNWSSMLHYVDAALLHPVNKQVYFFKGEHYYRYNLEHDRVDKVAKIGSCNECWKGIPEFPDAALVHPNGKAYFFKNKHYYRYDFSSNKVDKIGTIGLDGWKGLPNFIDAAIMHPNGHAYFIQGRRYYRFDFSKDKVTKVGTLNEDGWKGL